MSASTTFPAFVLAALSALTALPAAAESTVERSVTIHLIPRDSWAGEATDLRTALPDGRIFLYREGTYEPAAVLAANLPQTIAAGRFVWTAEATGYVTTTAGLLDTRSPAEGPQHKTILWPVTPACLLQLDQDRRWGALQRLDVVSLDHGVVLPLAVRDRRAAWVPIGRNLAYGVGGRGLTGIVRLSACNQGQAIELAPPEPPDAGGQALLASIAFEPPAKLAGEMPAVALAPLPSADPPLPAHPADEIVRIGDRVSAFFLTAPADTARDLVVAHPAFRTVRTGIEPAAGTARELPSLRARPRLDQPLSIDYRPLREHPLARLEVRRCEDRRAPRRRDRGRCPDVIHRAPLQPGLHDYLIPDLDNGEYLVDAQIDDERIVGLGSRLSFEVDPEQTEPVTLPPVPLREMELYGHLLLEGEPVDGAVLLVPLTAAAGTGLRFPTDEERQYHFYFFGRLPFDQPWPAAEAERARGYSASPASPHRLRACAASGPCRDFNLHSEIRGEGRLDLALDTDFQLEAQVYDAADQQPIAAAEILIFEDDRALFFDHGAVAWRRPAGAEGRTVTTDAAGRVRTALVSQPRLPLRFRKQGYQQRRLDLELLAGTVTRVRVGLEPADDRPALEGPRFLLATTAEPLAGAYLLAVGPGGDRDFACSGRTDAHGHLALAERCLDGNRYLVMHPRAALAVLPPGLVPASGDLPVAPAPPRPWRLRAVDQTGRPVAGAAISVELGGLRIGPNDLLLSQTRGAGALFVATDRRGEAILHGLDPAAGGARIEVEVQGRSGIAFVAEAAGAGLLEAVLTGATD